MNSSLDPAVRGAGSSVACVAELQLSSVIFDVEYLISYEEACPLLPSFPGAVQISLIEVPVGLLAARSVVVAGGVASEGSLVDKLGTLLKTDTFDASSVVFSAK